MPRQVRIQYENAIYHVMARGNRRGKIFTDDEDRELFLQTVQETCDRTGFGIFAWVLMDNHYHIVLKTPGANLVDGMSWLQNTYTRRFNSRHKLWGRLFGDRYRSILVEDDSSDNRTEATNSGYLPTLIDYVHLNPARARIIQAKNNQSVSTYPWSSLSQGYQLPATKRPHWLLVTEGLECFDLADTARDRRRYIKNLDAQIESEEASRLGLVKINNQSLNSTLRRGWYWGSEEFRETLLNKLNKAASRPGSRNYKSSSQGSDTKLAEANQILTIGAQHFKIRPASELKNLPRGDRRRVAIAWALWKSTSMPQSWIASQTSLRSATNVSRQVHQFDKLSKKALSPLEGRWRARFT